METPMKNPPVSRRTMLKGAAALLADSALSTRVMASAPPSEPVTQALIDAAKKEGQVVYYTSTDLPVAEKVAKAFEAKYPGIAVRTERTGAERVFQRIGQEYSSNIHAVDVVNSSDAAQRASPICLIPNGRARSSRLIQATAAPS
jgi:iron(III) transport system substrate-binding protein